MIRTPIQKRFADVDMLGHVNNVNLQHYFDLGKNDFCARVLSLGSLLEGVGMIVARTETDYGVQARLHQTHHVETGVEKVGNKSLVLLQRIVNSDTGEICAVSRSVMVAFDFSKQESVAVPDAWRGPLAGHQA